MKDLRSRVVRGAAWTLMSSLGRHGLALAIGILLARLLTPQDFGTVAMVVVFTGFAQMFFELGLSGALVQRKEVTQEHLSTTFWVNMGAGAALAAAFVLCAPLIATFYSRPQLHALTVVLALVFLLEPLSVVQRALRQRDLDFRLLALIDLLSMAAAGLAAIGMALAGCGVWSLVARPILFAALRALLLWRPGRWRPSPRFCWASLRELLGFSLTSLGTRVYSYWVVNLSSLLIGRVLGAGPLGLYTKAHSFTFLPSNQISRSIVSVMFPALSRIQDQKERVANVYVRIVRAVAFVTFPVLVGFFVVAERFVQVLLGPQWLGMVPVLRVLALLGMIQSVATLVGNLFLSQGRADLQLKVSLVFKTLRVVGIVIGLRWGILGVAVGLTAASAVANYPEFHFAGRLVGLSYRRLVGSLSGILAASACMGLAVFWLGIYLDALSTPAGLALLLQILAGTLAYGSLAVGLRLRALADIRGARV